MTTPTTPAPLCPVCHQEAEYHQNGFEDCLAARVRELEDALSDAVIIVEAYKLKAEGEGTNNPAIYRYGNWHNLGSFVEEGRRLLSKGK